MGAEGGVEDYLLVVEEDSKLESTGGTGLYVVSTNLTITGPGKLTKALSITREHNRLSVLGERVWIEDDGARFEIRTDKRVGIAYASQEDQDRPWRFILA